MQEDQTPDSSDANPDDSVKERLRELLENNQSDFSAWTSLITDVEKDKPNDIQKICLVYDSFLSEFPLCYGYWKKYAGHKARLCTFKEVEEVYERAVKAATYSVDLWVSYCIFGEWSYDDPGDIRRLYERGLSFVGKDYLCHLLWDRYIEFEYSQKQWFHLARTCINTLRFPTKKLHSYYEGFKKLVAVWEEEMGCRDNDETPSDSVPSCDMTDIKSCGYVETSNVITNLLDQQDDLCRPNNVKKYISIGELLYQQSNLLDGKIHFFETRIRRPYFHVKPLDDWQIENWHQYLDFVQMQGDFDWTVKLYERCLIPCANYSEFWIRYVEFVEARGGREIANYAIARALSIFLKNVPAFHIFSAMFKEQIGDVTGARAAFLQSGMNLAPDFIENVNREANMEKRMGNTESACMIYEKAIEMAKEKQNEQVLSVLYTSFARFSFAVSGSIDAAREVFIKGIQQIPCKSIIEGLIHFVTMHGGAGQVPKLDSIVANAISPGTEVSRALSSDDREDISKLFLEFVDLYGTIHEIKIAWDRHRRLFPHIMRPPPPPTTIVVATSTTTTCHNTATGNIPLDKSMEGRNGMLVAFSHDACGDIGHYGADMHVLDNASLKNDAPILGEGAMMCELQPEEYKIGTNGTEELVEVVQKQSTPEGTELLLEIGESVHESHDVVQISEAPSEYIEIKNQVQRHPDQGFDSDLRPPALDNLSIHSPPSETQQSNPSTSYDCIAQEVTSSAGENKLKDGGNSDKISANNESNLVKIKSGTSSQVNLQKDNSPLLQTGDPTPPEAEVNPQFQMQAQEHTNLLHALPVDGTYPQNASSGGICTQMYYGGQAPEDPSSRFQGSVQASQIQQWQVPTQLQYPPAATSSQMLIAQGYPCQPQTWANTQDQQANQTQGQYSMASASQVYPSGILAWPGQNMQQQAFVYAQPQPSTQPTSQPQIQVYQQSLQGNEQYGYFQGSQGVQPHIWHYYQQQLHYLQQQQNQQLYNHPLQQLQIEHLQQLQQKLTQQQQSQNQLPLNQLQTEQQNQQQLVLQEQQQSPQQEQNHHQQQHQSQFQQQNQQVDHTQQQQNLLYLQQHQQQMYLQQQQLYLQQQQQLQLLQQQQQQQLLQEHQQLSLQQQQQQQLLHHQQHEQQQQISALEPKASSSDVYLQQTLLVQQHSTIQYGEDHDEQVVSSQGEGTTLQNAENSGTSYSTLQKPTTIS